MRRWFRLRQDGQPDAIYMELVHIVYTAMPQVISLALGVIIATGFLVMTYGDPAYWALLGAAIATSVLRIAFMLRFPKEGCRDALAARRWDILYGIGSLAIGSVIAAMSLITFSKDHPGAHLLAVGLTMAMAAGHGSRIAVRPWIALMSGTVIMVSLGVAGAAHADPLYQVLGYLTVIYLFSYYETVLRYYGVIVDRLMKKREIEHLASHDPLTGLANRRAVETALAAADRHWEIDGRCFATLCLDLDGFKAINDMHGHAVGDALLCAVADRLREASIPSDLCGRLGGDEFALIRKDVENAESVALTAAAIIASLSQPYRIADRILHVGVSIGGAIAREAMSGGDALMIAADRALYRAKNAGKGCYRIAGETDMPRLDAGTVDAATGDLSEGGPPETRPAIHLAAAQ